MREPEADVIEKVKELRKRALFLDAWELLKPFSPPEEWANPEHQVIGARMMGSLGSWHRQPRDLDGIDEAGRGCSFSGPCPLPPSSKTPRRRAAAVSR